MKITSKIRTASLAALLLAGLPAGQADASAAPRQIVFESDRSGNNDIWVMDEDGSNARRLTNDRAFDQGPSWSPDGTRIVFHSFRSGGGDIYSMAADGSDVVRLTDDPAFDGYPVWGPTGKIAFISNREDTLYSTNEIWVMNADGSNPTRLTYNTWPDGYPSWTPDGKIVFASQPVLPGTEDLILDDTEIFRMNADGSGLTQLTDNACEDRAPATSPNGLFIAFASDCGRPFTGVSVMDADGSNIRRITQNLDYEDWPTWSPDGLSIVYASSKDGPLLVGMDVFVVSLIPNTTTNITQSPVDFDGIPWYRPA